MFDAYSLVADFSSADGDVSKPTLIPVASPRCWELTVTVPPAAAARRFILTQNIRMYQYHLATSRHTTTDNTDTVLGL